MNIMDKISVHKYCMFRIGTLEFERKGFDSGGVCRLFCNNKDADNHKKIWI